MDYEIVKISEKQTWKNISRWIDFSMIIKLNNISDFEKKTTFFINFKVNMTKFQAKIIIYFTTFPTVEHVGRQIDRASESKFPAPISIPTFHPSPYQNSPRT